MCATPVKADWATGTLAGSRRTVYAPAHVTSQYRTRVTAPGYPSVLSVARASGQGSSAANGAELRFEGRDDGIDSGRHLTVLQGAIRVLQDHAKG